MFGAVCTSTRRQAQRPFDDQRRPDLPRVGLNSHETELARYAISQTRSRRRIGASRFLQVTPLGDSPPTRGESGVSRFSNGNRRSRFSQRPVGRSRNENGPPVRQQPAQGPVIEGRERPWQVVADGDCAAYGMTNSSNVLLHRQPEAESVAGQPGCGDAAAERLFVGR